MTRFILYKLPGQGHFDICSGITLAFMCSVNCFYKAMAVVLAKHKPLLTCSSYSYFSSYNVVDTQKDVSWNIGRYFWYFWRMVTE